MENGQGREDEAEGNNIRAAVEPWWLGEDGDGASMVIDWQQPNPQLHRTGADRLARAFTPESRRRLAAVYLAGRLVAADAAGYEVTEAFLIEDYSAPGAAAGSMLRFGAQTAAFEGRVRTLVAGQVAARMWLEVTGRLTALRYTATWMLARADHNTLLGLDAGEPAAFLYGGAQAPEGFAGRSVDVESFMAEARVLLAERWHRVRALADQLAWHGQCQGALMASILAAPAPREPAFDAAAAESGRLVAGYPLAAIDAAVEHWVRVLNRKILRQNEKQAAILLEHPEYAKAPGEDDGTLTFTPEQQQAFRAALREELIRLIGARVQRGEGGLGWELHGERRVLVLSTEPALPPALIGALEAVGGGLYEFMLPYSAASVIAPDAAWSRDGSARETLLWCVDDRVPVCTRWIERNGSATERCARPLLHPGRCAADEEAAQSADEGAGAPGR